MGDNHIDVSISSVNTSDLSDFSDISSSDNESDDDIYEWSDSVFDHRPSEFDSFVGPKMPLGLDATPDEYFFQLFPEVLIEKIVDQTNLYARRERSYRFSSNVLI